jgi:hypothetical protein
VGPRALAALRPRHQDIQAFLLVHSPIHSPIVPARARLVLSNCALVEYLLVGGNCERQAHVEDHYAQSMHAPGLLCCCAYSVKGSRDISEPCTKCGYGPLLYCPSVSTEAGCSDKFPRLHLGQRPSHVSRPYRITHTFSQQKPRHVMWLKSKLPSVFAPHAYRHVWQGTHNHQTSITRNGSLGCHSANCAE